MTLVFAFLITRAQAQLMALDLGKPGAQEVRVSGKYQGSAATEQSEGSVTLPVYQTQRQTYALTAKARHVALDGLSTATDVTPTPELGDYQFGAAWGIENSERTKWGASATYGSASDRPFAGDDVNAFSVTGSHQFATSERTSWTLFVNYANNRPLLNDVPLPGFAYNVVSESKTHGWNLGFPFANFWYVPSRKLIVSAFYLVPATFLTSVGYFVWGPVQANLKFDYGQQLYMRHGRTQSADRILFDQKRAILSAKSYFGRDTFTELELAYVFDQSLYDGRNAFALRSQRLTRENEWRVGLAVQVAL